MAAAPQVVRLPFFRSLRFKVGVGYFLLVLINILVTAWAIYNFVRLTGSTRTILTENVPSMVSLENMARSVERHESAIALTINGDTANGRRRFEEARKAFSENFRAADRARDIPDLSLIIDNISSTYAGYLLVSDSIFSLASAGSFAGARTFYHDIVTPFSARLSDNCFWLLEENQKILQDVARETGSTSDEATIAVLLASLLAVGLSVVTMIQFTRRIIEPAERLTDTVHRIGRGRLDLKLDILTNDEIGELSREFNKMTERLRQFEELNIQKIISEKHKSETIVESIGDAIIVCDPDARIQLMNHSALDLLGLRAQDVFGRHARDVIRDDRLRSIIVGGPEGGRAAEPYLSFRYRGKTIYLRPRISVIPAESGEPLGFVLVLHDVTVYKEIDRMKSDFMATVSHEFRTPLTSINMGVDILRQGILGPLTAEQEDLLQGSKQDCERLTKLVRELLQLSKLEAGKIEIKTEPIDVAATIESTLQPLKLPFREKGVDLVVSIEGGLPMLHGDEQQFSWVVSNLVNNALKHTDNGGKVEILSRRENGAILVQIRDTGHGIPEDQLETIFDKFVQVKSNNVATPGSVGLGLSIAKEIVELYGGSIWAESVVNEGSVFSFRLPLGETPKGAAP